MSAPTSLASAVNPLIDRWMEFSKIPKNFISKNFREDCDFFVGEEINNKMVELDTDARCRDLVVLGKAYFLPKDFAAPKRPAFKCGIVFVLGKEVTFSGINLTCKCIVSMSKERFFRTITQPCVRASVRESQSSEEMGTLVPPGLGTFSLNSMIDQMIKGSTPLLWATMKGHVDAAALLVHAGANIHARDSHHLTPVIHAARNRLGELTKLFLAKGANGNDALLFAAETGEERVIETLVGAGVGIEGRDPDQRTPLMLAAIQGHKTIVRLLLASRASIDARDGDHATALKLAAGNGHASVVRHLLRAGAGRAGSSRPEMKDPDRVPSSTSCDVGTTGVPAPLKEQPERTADIQEALMVAAGSDHMEVLKLLIAEGADIEARDSLGWTPLTWAAVTDCPLAIKLLIDAGANVDAPNSQGMTARLLAEHYDSVQALWVLTNPVIGGHLHQHVLQSAIKKPAPPGAIKQVRFMGIMDEEKGPVYRGLAASTVHPRKVFKEKSIRYFKSLLDQGKVIFGDEDGSLKAQILSLFGDSEMPEPASFSPKHELSDGKDDDDLPS